MISISVSPCPFIQGVLRSSLQNSVSRVCCSGCVPKFVKWLGAELCAVTRKDHIHLGVNLLVAVYRQPCVLFSLVSFSTKTSNLVTVTNCSLVTNQWFTRALDLHK